MDDIIINADKLTKEYDVGFENVRALDGVSFEVHRGELVRRDRENQHFCIFSAVLIRRAAEYAEEDKRPVSKVYLQRSREKDDYEKIKDMFLSSGFEIYKQSDDDITLIKTSFSN